MYLFPPSYTTSSYYLYHTSLPCLLYTSDPITFSHYHCFTTLYTTTTCLPSSTLDLIAFNLYPLAPIASQSQYSHPSITTIHNLMIRP
ncbi:hypothetical protein CROQUDRAFT_666830, partial [Cronartium quercuum f. sp. fusiforme G11]